MEQRVGSCSLCGGDVYGIRGGWWATIPPPPDTCSQCGATRGDDVIVMNHVPHRPYVDTTTNPYDLNNTTGWRHK